MTHVASPPSVDEPFRLALTSRPYGSAARDYERALEYADSDPASSMTSSASCLEALLWSYVGCRDLDVPENSGLTKLWKFVHPHLRTDSRISENTKIILSHLDVAIVTVATSRNKHASAHGRKEGHLDPSSVCSRFILQMAVAVGSCILKCWDEADGVSAPLPFGRAKKGVRTPRRSSPLRAATALTANIRYVKSTKRSLR